MINKRVFSKTVDILIVNIISFSISWGVDNNYLDDKYKILAGLIFLFFNLTIELLDRQNRSFGKMLFGLELDFPKSKFPDKLNVIIRRVLNFFEVYFFIGLFVIYLNKGKTLSDLATGSEVYQIK